MLIQFSIENHRSIKDSAVISFAASKDKSLESYLLHPDEKRALLPAIAIYGANAAGKSNVLHALMTMKDMVVGAGTVCMNRGILEIPFIRSRLNLIKNFFVHNKILHVKSVVNEKNCLHGGALA